jgi:hypothetical protein
MPVHGELDSCPLIGEGLGNPFEILLLSACSADDRVAVSHHVGGICQMAAPSVYSVYMMPVLVDAAQRTTAQPARPAISRLINT